MVFGSNRIVGVLYGGPSSEYEVSLQTGDTVLKNLRPEKYTAREILIDKDGVWHTQGMARKPEQALKGIDVVFNALHGEYGEDGQVQRVLEHFRIPYTGSDVFGSALAMNKILAKRRLVTEGIKTPAYAIVRSDDGDVDEQVVRVFRSLPLPLVVKPAALGSSVGVSLARDFHSLQSAMRRSLSHAPVVLVEEFVAGREATCGVVEDFRGEKMYSLLPIEIRVPPHKELFDYEAKYTGISEEICPGNFSPEHMGELQRLAVLAHEALGLRHYSRSDFIVSPKRGIFYLETNTLPGLTSESLMPKALRAVGSNLPEFLDHVLSLALARS